MNLRNFRIVILITTILCFGIASGEVTGAGRGKTTTTGRPIVQTGGVPRPLTIVTTEMPMGKIGKPYDHQIIVIGGVKPYRFDFSIGLPVAYYGVRLYTDGSVRGTPVLWGRLPIPLRVTDAVGHVVTKGITVPIKK